MMAPVSAVGASLTRFREVSRRLGGVGAPAATYGASATVGGRLARPTPCVPRHERLRDRRLLAVMPGCRGGAPAGMAHGCAALRSAVGPAHVVFQSVTGAAPVDRFFLGPRGNSCRSGGKVGRLVVKLHQRKGYFW